MDTRQSRICKYLCVLSLASILASCANTAGKNYALAKVDNSGYLTDPFVTIGEGWDDHVKEVNGNLEIRLADHFLAYLASLGQPELAIFSRATITDPEDRTKQIVFEQILLNTEDQSTYSAGNQGGGGTLKDVVLLPAIKYRNQDIRLELRVVELDSEDNERSKSVISQAAQTGGVFKLVAGPEVTAIAGALNFLVANNKDDIEFSIDIGVGPNSPQVQALNGNLTDVVLQPRVGTWVIIKTELPGRLYFAGDTASIASDAVVWTVANTLKLGTLNIANWWNNDKDQTDYYMKLFGNPLGLSSVAVTEPRLKDSKLTHVEGRFFGACGAQLTSPTKEREFPMLYSSGSLQVKYPCETKNQDGTVKSDHSLIPFRDKSYMALSFSSPAAAVDASLLASLSDKIADLNIATTQLKGAEFDKELTAAMQAIESIAHVRNALEVTEEQMTAAQDAATITESKTENFEALRKKIEALDIDDEAKKRLLTSAEIEMTNVETRSKRNITIDRENKLKQKMQQAGIDLSGSTFRAKDDPQSVRLKASTAIDTVILMTNEGEILPNAQASVSAMTAPLYQLTLTNLAGLKGGHTLEFHQGDKISHLPIYIAASTVDQKESCTTENDVDGMITRFNEDGGPLNSDSHPTKSWQVCSAKISACNQLSLEVGWKTASTPNRTVDETREILEASLRNRKVEVKELKLNPEVCS